MKALFIVNTPYQLFNAINIRQNVLKEKYEQVDIILSNHSRVCEYEMNVRTSTIFYNTYVADSLDLARKFYFFDDKKKNRALYKPLKYLNKILKIDYTQYDNIFFANIDGFVNLIFRYVEMRNCSVEFDYFEDGWSSYILDLDNFAYSPYEKYFYEVLNEEILQKNIDYIWIYRPILYSAKEENKDKLRQIPQVDLGDINFKSIVNAIFAYEKCGEYEKENIFLEEAFCEDGYHNNDFEIINTVCAYVGKENFLLKRHPRLKADRWEESGIQVNKDLKIPWEVLIMNCDFSNKRIFTISSNACMTPQLVFNISIPIFFMKKALRGRVSKTYQKPEFDVFVDKYEQEFGTYNFFRINDIKSLDTIFKKYLYQQQFIAFCKEEMEK